MAWRRARAAARGGTCRVHGAGRRKRAKESNGGAEEGPPSRTLRPVSILAGVIIGALLGLVAGFVVGFARRRRATREHRD